MPLRFMLNWPTCDFGPMFLSPPPLHTPAHTQLHHHRLHYIILLTISHDIPWYPITMISYRQHNSAPSNTACGYSLHSSGWEPYNKHVITMCWSCDELTYLHLGQGLLWVLSHAQFCATCPLTMGPATVAAIQWAYLNNSHLPPI